MGRAALNRALPFVLAAVVAAGISACGNTLQVQPVPHNELEGMIQAPFRVYWLGGTFRGLAVQQVAHDPGGAYSVQYGNCLTGGQGTCKPPLLVVTSPENTFVPGGSTSTRSARIRGLPAVEAQSGQVVMIPTGNVVVDILASDPRLARAAARNVVPINAPGGPDTPLPPSRPTNAYSGRPFNSQVPNPLRPLHR
jgi:hypothetical protein